MKMRKILWSSLAILLFVSLLLLATSCVLIPTFPPQTEEPVTVTPEDTSEPTPTQTLTTETPTMIPPTPTPTLTPIPPTPTPTPIPTWVTCLSHDENYLGWEDGDILPHSGCQCQKGNWFCCPTEEDGNLLIRGYNYPHFGSGERPEYPDFVGHTLEEILSGQLTSPVSLTLHFTTYPTQTIYLTSTVIAQDPPHTSTQCLFIGEVVTLTLQ